MMSVLTKPFDCTTSVFCSEQVMPKAYSKSCLAKTLLSNTRWALLNLVGSTYWKASSMGPTFRPVYFLLFFDKTTLSSMAKPWTSPARVAPAVRRAGVAETPLFDLRAARTDCILEPLEVWSSITPSTMSWSSRFP